MSKDDLREKAHEILSMNKEELAKFAESLHLSFIQGEPREFLFTAVSTREKEIAEKVSPMAEYSFIENMDFF